MENNIDIIVLKRRFEDHENFEDQVGVWEEIGKLMCHSPEEFAPLLKSDDVEMRVAAAWALSHIKKSGSIELLIDSLSDGNLDVRLQVIRSLGMRGRAEVVESLLALFTDETPEIRKEAVSMVGFISIPSPPAANIDEPRVIDALMPLLSDPNAGVRAVGADALGVIGMRAGKRELAGKDPQRDGRPIKPLIELLGDLDSEVRAQSAEALGHMQAEEAFEPVKNVLKDQHEYVRAAAAQALVKIDKEAALEPILELTTDPDPWVRSSLMTALYYTQHGRAIDAIIDALKDDAQEVRSMAAMMLIEVKDPRVIRALIQVLGDESWEVRDAAITALQVQGAEDALESLLPMLDDPDTAVAWSAVHAIATIGGEKAADVLIEQFNSTTDKRKHGYLGSALTELNDPRADAILHKAVEQKDLDIIQSAFRYFIRKGIPDSEPVLIEALENADDWMRAHEMACAFILSENEALKKAGRQYLNERYDPDKPVDTTHRRVVLWGSGR